MNIDELLDKAFSAAEKSYSPYSHFRVGAALLTDDGQIFTGTNVENRSFGATICAERSAICTAVSQGNRTFKAICIVSPDYDDFLPPCGICRQFLSEFNLDIEVILSNKDRKFIKMPLSQLLPYDSLTDLKG